MTTGRPGTIPGRPNCERMKTVDTTNEFDGEAHNVVQAGTTGPVYTGTQIVGEGLAIQGDVHGGINLSFGGTPTPDEQEQQQ